jgi:ABC-type transport system involved in multi-copper enzyme maturation permease subunit
MNGNDESLPVENIRVLSTLMRKDFRLFRGLLIGLICMGLTPYPVILIIAAQTKDTVKWPDFVSAAATIGMMLTALLASVFGGAAIGGERQNRTADFLGLLPITRGQIALSKGVVSFLILAACTAPHLVVQVLSLGGTIYFWQNWVNDFVPAAAIFTGLLIGFFGVAWLLGSFLSSAAISAAVSIAVTITACVTLAVCMDGREHRVAFQYCLAALPFAMGTASLIGGTLYYLKRVES